MQGYHDKQYKVGALFVSRHSVYKSMPYVDCYDRDRDALSFNGKCPVVCHPPCGGFGAYANVYKGGDDKHLFDFSVATMRRNGGVLEHPSGSKAFEYKPDGRRWSNVAPGEWVCIVYQGNYGHKAPKATWLHYIGDSKPFELDFSVSYKSGRIEKMSHTQRELTPTPFAKLLFDLAVHSRR